MSATELKLFNASGKEVGTKSVPAELFAGEIVPSLLHQVVRWQRAKRRAGSHSTLTRAQMSGGGRKPWRQKGLGRARAGSNTSPLWVGGGIAHGPKPRDYEFSLNKKERRKALCGAVTARTQEGKCLALTDFGLSQIKTKKAFQVLASLGIGENDKVLVVLGSEEREAALSLRNMERVKATLAAGLNVYDVLYAGYLVITEQGLAEIEKRFASADERLSEEVGQ